MLMLTALLALGGLTLGQQTTSWTPQETRLLTSLSLNATLTPRDPTNAVVNDPRAVSLGHRLFFEPRFSPEGNVACATCHKPELMFTDAKTLSEGIGMTSRNAPTIVGAAWNSWQFWDGRSDSMWSQALGPLENPSEHGFTRAGVAQVINGYYRSEYESLFGSLPDLDNLYRFPERASPIGDMDAKREWNQMSAGDRAQINRLFVNVGKVLAAYEYQIKPGRSRFDRYVQRIASSPEASAAFTTTEIAGLRLFTGAAGCVGCHSGPMLTDNRFHNTGVPRNSAVMDDFGRSSGLESLSHGEFTCSSIYSDARTLCPSGQPAPEARDLRAYKTPSLRTASVTAPFMHAGQFASLSAVLQHYRAAPKAPLGTSELRPVLLTDTELLQVEAFLRSLEAPLDTPAQLLVAPTR